MRGSYRMLIENSGRDRPLGIFRCRRDDNIKINLQEFTSM
jgi:hypothetical protein